MQPTNIRAFMRSLLSSWLTGMSGPASVPLSIAAMFVSSGVAKVGLGVTGLLCLWGAAYGLWQRERTMRNTAEQSLVQLRQNRLEISFAGFGLDVDENTPPRRVVGVRVTNKTDCRIDDC